MTTKPKRELSEKQKAALAKGAANKRDFTSETARAAVRKREEKRLSMKFFREQAMKEFEKDGRSLRAFAQFSMQAGGGDVASMETMRKWIGEDPEEKANDGVNIQMFFDSKEELEALQKWAKKK